MVGVLTKTWNIRVKWTHGPIMIEFIPRNNSILFFMTISWRSAGRSRISAGANGWSCHISRGYSVLKYWYVGLAEDPKGFLLGVVKKKELLLQVAIYFRISIRSCVCSSSMRAWDKNVRLYYPLTGNKIIFPIC